MNNKIGIGWYCFSSDANENFVAVTQGDVGTDDFDVLCVNMFDNKYPSHLYLSRFITGVYKTLSDSSIYLKFFVEEFDGVENYITAVTSAISQNISMERVSLQMKQVKRLLTDGLKKQYPYCVDFSQGELNAALLSILALDTR